MTRRLSTTLLAAVAILFAGASVAKATNVTWTINSTASSFTLRIPDQSISLSGLTGTVRVRNQNGSAWTTNKFLVQGSVNTDYNEVLQQRIQFIAGQTNILALNTGNYRPNPAAWNVAGANNSFGNTSTAPGNIGGRISATLLSIFTVDIGYLRIFDGSFDIGSNFLPFVMNGSVNLQANGGSAVGLTDGKLSLDGNKTSILGQDITINDVLASQFDTGLFTNKSAVGTITNLGGLNRRLVIPIQQNFSVDLEGNIVQANTVGTLVLDAVVPEPSTMLLAGLGLASLAICVRRRMKNR